MTTRVRPNKNASQIIFDMHAADHKYEYQTMNLQTIPNAGASKLVPHSDFMLKTDDIDGAHYTPPVVHPRNLNLDTSDISGTHTHPMVDTSKKAIDLLTVDDIAGAKPRIIRELPHSKRVLNPVDPDYKLPSYTPPAPVVPKFIRNPMKNDDVEGAASKPLYPSSAPRDIMRTDDIVGGTHHVKLNQLNCGDRTFNVKDINEDGVYKTKRITNPLNPVYHIDGKDLTDANFGHTKAPMHEMPGSNRTLDVSDIPGAQAGSATQKYKDFKVTQIQAEEADSKNSILMTPSMKKQTDELNRQKQIYKMRGEKIRKYETRNLHTEVEKADEVQAILRKQREAKPTFY